MNPLRRRLRRLKIQAAATLLFRGQKIVVASTGRSGSTILHEAIRNGMVRACCPRIRNPFLLRKLNKLAGGFTPRIANVHSDPTPVQKTHDQFDPRYAYDAKYVFVYGDPLESALSVKRMYESAGQGWFENHIRNLNSEGHIEELFTRDILNYERQLNSWQQGDVGRVLLLRYEQLWDRVDSISAFVGFPVMLPMHRERNTILPDNVDNPALFEYLRSIMLSLDERVSYKDGES